jgi:Protein of unknown function (DUF2442)
MNVATAGTLTSGVEVSDISPHGFWLLIGSEKLFVAFASFPWFRNATIAQITKIEMPSVRHLYWPDLDVDLSVESIRNPDAFPLVSRTST